MFIFSYLQLQELVQGQRLGKLLAKRLVVLLYLAIFNKIRKNLLNKNKYSKNNLYFYTSSHKGAVLLRKRQVSPGVTEKYVGFVHCSIYGAISGATVF